MSGASVPRTHRSYKSLLRAAPAYAFLGYRELKAWAPRAAIPYNMAQTVITSIELFINGAPDWKSAINENLKASSVPARSWFNARKLRLIDWNTPHGFMALAWLEANPEYRATALIGRLLKYNAFEAPLSAKQIMDSAGYTGKNLTIREMSDVPPGALETEKEDQVWCANTEWHVTPLEWLKQMRLMLNILKHRDPKRHTLLIFWEPAGHKRRFFLPFVAVYADGSQTKLSVRQTFEKECADAKVDDPVFRGVSFKDPPETIIQKQLASELKQSDTTYMYVQETPDESKNVQPSPWKLHFIYKGPNVLNAKASMETLIRSFFSKGVLAFTPKVFQVTSADGSGRGGYAEIGLVPSYAGEVTPAMPTFSRTEYLSRRAITNILNGRLRGMRLGNQPQEMQSYIQRYSAPGTGDWRHEAGSTLSWTAAMNAMNLLKVITNHLESKQQKFTICDANPRLLTSTRAAAVALPVAWAQEIWVVPELTINNDLSLENKQWLSMVTQGIEGPRRTQTVPLDDVWSHPDATAVLLQMVWGMRHEVNPNMRYAKHQEWTYTRLETRLALISQSLERYASKVLEGKVGSRKHPLTICIALPGRRNDLNLDSLPDEGYPEHKGSYATNLQRMAFPWHSELGHWQGPVKHPFINTEAVFCGPLLFMLIFIWPVNPKAPPPKQIALPAAASAEIQRMRYYDRSAAKSAYVRFQRVADIKLSERVRQAHQAIAHTQQHKR